MQRQSKRSRQLALFTLLAFLLSGLPMAVATPKAVMAQSSSNVDSPLSTEEDEPADDEIVYIDDDGYIQVLDPFQLPNHREIQWSSPDDGWRSAALGDFNGDGDMEIVAIGGGSDDDNNDNGRLVIYDPVVSAGTAGLPTINGIPWDKLYEFDLGKDATGIDGKVTLVAAGNFDDNIETDEILFGFFMQDEAKLPGKDEIFRLSIIKNANQVPDGRNWTYHIPRKDDSNEWNLASVGNIDHEGADELALLDEDSGEVNVYRIGENFERIWGDSATNNPYRGVTIGDIYNDVNLQVIVSREIKSSENLFFYRYDSETDELIQVAKARFTPYPRFLWVADVNASGDDELFFLRRDQDPRLVGLNRGNDGVITLEDNLNSDNYRNGVGGDFDADGRQEIAISSDEEIIIYPTLEKNMDREEYDYPTDRRTLVAGDLDAEGFLPGPAFALRRTGGNDENVETIFETLETGLQGPIRGYSLHNIGSPATFSFTYQVEGNPEWLKVTANTSTVSDVTPAPLFLQFDARDLLPGKYTSALVFSTSNPDVINSPHRVPIEYTVDPAAVNLSPESVSVIYYPCTDQLAERTPKIQITGSPDVAYNAVIVEVPAVQAAMAELTAGIVNTYINDEGALVMEDANGKLSTMALPADPRQLSASAINIDWPSSSPWVDATSDDGIIPDEMTLTVKPEQRRADVDEAVLVIVADKSAGSAPANVRIVPLNLMCAQGQSNLPIVRGE